jgi:predicted ester cyclase
MGILAATGLRRRKRAKGAPMADAKLIVKRLIEEPWKGNRDVIDEYAAPGYVGHDSAAPEPHRGPAGLRANFEKYIAGFPDGRITVDDQIAEGDKVATRWTGRGAQTGEIAGIAPTGKEVTVSGMTISKLEGGLVVEEWTTWDTLGMLVQLGAIPEPARA